MSTRTVYIPRLIESAEQAEALPEGTVVFIEKPWGDTTRREVGTKDHGEWWGSDCDVNFLGAEGLVSWTALVPIEAEEEWTAMGTDDGEPWIALVGPVGIDGSREEAQQYVDRFGGFIAHRTRTPWEETP